MAGPLAHLEGRLEGTVASFREQRGIPGIVAGVVLDQDLTWTSSTGSADLAADRPMEASTLFRIASITKTIVATAIMQLRDEDRLSLDDPVVRFVPEFHAARNPFGSIDSVTLRGLLTHTSGLQYLAPSEPGEDPDAVIEGFVTRQQMLERLGRASVVIPPGTWKYSNLAYALLGEVIRAVSGESLEQYLRRAVFDPLGMTETTFEPEPGLASRCATGYRSRSYEDLTPPAADWHRDWARPAGGLWSTLPDMARWISQQFRTTHEHRRGEGQVLDGPSLAEMHVATVLKDGAWTYAQGLGWASLRRGELTVSSHSGGLPGWRTNVLFRPADRFGVVVMLNTHNDAPGLGLDLAEIVWAAARDTRASAEPAVRRGPVPIRLREYLGSYAARDYDSTIRIEYRSGSLATVSHDLLDAPGTSSIDLLTPTDRPDWFHAAGGFCPGEDVYFVRDETGVVIRFVVGGQAFYRLDVVEADPDHDGPHVASADLASASA